MTLQSGAVAAVLDSDHADSAGVGPRQAPKRDLADFAARAVIVALFTYMAVNLGFDFTRTGRLTSLLLLASEALVVVFTAFRRRPMIIDRSLHARVVTALSIIGPPLVRPASLVPILPEFVTATASVIGLLVAIGGKLSLGRSFGIMPANRGIVSSGLYRFVRHPIYMGYLITHAAFIAANPSAWNITLLLTSDLALMVRAVREELTLAVDPEYRAYQARVRWRVIPGAF